MQKLRAISTIFDIVCNVSLRNLLEFLSYRVYEKVFPFAKVVKVIFQNYFDRQTYKNPFRSVPFKNFYDLLVMPNRFVRLLLLLRCLTKSHSDFGVLALSSLPPLR